jgi:hypothetical protein
MVMPFLARALLEKRARFARWKERMGEKALFAKHPAAKGYLRDERGYRLMDRREELTKKLFAELGGMKKHLLGGLGYPLAGVANAKKPAKKAPARQGK